MSDDLALDDERAGSARLPTRVVELASGEQIVHLGAVEHVVDLLAGVQTEVLVPGVSLVDALA